MSLVHVVHAGLKDAVWLKQFFDCYNCIQPSYGARFCTQWMTSDLMTE